MKFTPVQVDVWRAVKTASRRAIHIGVDPRTPPVDVQYIVGTNFIALLGIGLCLVALPISVLDYNYPAISVNTLIQLFMAATLWMSHRRHHGWAAFYICLVAGAGVLGQVVNLGVDAGLHYWLLVIVMVPFLVFPSEYVVTPVLVALEIAGGFTWVAVNYVHDPASPYTTSILYAQTSVCLGLIAMGYYARSLTIGAQRQILAAQARSDHLLLNILPASIAERLKQDESAMIAERFEGVSVVFADLVNFTPLAESVSAVELVTLLNDIFSAFDDVCERHGLEKIKTVGDMYMAGAGLPTPRADHAARAARFALDIRRTLATIDARVGAGLSLRIGIHSGPVVAGVIGKQKFAYDLWGDVVNTASRMESHGIPGGIQITEATRQALGDGFVCESRGEQPFKGKGPLRTFLLLAEVDPAHLPQPRSPAPHE